MQDLLFGFLCVVVDFGVSLHSVHGDMLIWAGCGSEGMFGLFVISLVGCFEGVGLRLFAD